MGSDLFWLYEAAAVAGIMMLAQVLRLWFDWRERRTRSNWLRDV